MSTLAGLAHPVAGWIAGLFVFWAAMTKVFDLDFFGACMIVVVAWLLRMVLVGLLLSALM